MPTIKTSMPAIISVMLSTVSCMKTVDEMLVNMPRIRILNVWVNVATVPNRIASIILPLELTRYVMSIILP